MGDLFWPGDDRAGDHFTSESFLEAMVAVEEEWAGVDLDGVVGPDHLEWLENESEVGGNPVIGLVERLRDGTGIARLHRGLTSQDVVDSALMRMAEAAVADLLGDLDRIVDGLAALATAHRDTPMVARTLTQHAIPTTFGFRVAQWLTGVLDARDDVRRLAFPAQLGGAAGTRAGMVELGRDVALDPLPWHTTRASVTRIGDALAGCTDACGRIANDVLAMGRPELGELAEGSGGGSSTMPNKANPVLSVLVRRAALTTPQLAATLHLAAASQVDDRADGGWHAEWATLRDLVRRTLVAVSQTHDLLDGLEVRPDRMARTLAGAGDDVLAEQRSLAEQAGHDPAPSYLGQAGAIVDAVVHRATVPNTLPKTQENR
ncbi:lyase family protein [Nocardioides sp. W7]|uniref:lyase family protein n=1 Tax=Nocardioides sp. W7 TaxID=2931390 RepID=UPI001FD43BF9|nr:lyase family protein [Nocardioides sp. W7]